MSTWCRSQKASTASSRSSSAGTSLARYVRSHQSSSCRTATYFPVARPKSDSMWSSIPDVRSWRTQRIRGSEISAASRRVWSGSPLFDTMSSKSVNSPARTLLIAPANQRGRLCVGISTLTSGTGASTTQCLRTAAARGYGMAGTMWTRPDVVVPRRRAEERPLP